MIRTRLKGAELSRLLARKNKSQNWLAMRIGVTSGYLSQLICGIRFPSGSVRERLQAEFMDASFDDLFEIIDNGQGTSR